MSKHFSILACLEVDRNTDIPDVLDSLSCPGCSGVWEVLSSLTSSLGDSISSLDSSALLFKCLFLLSGGLSGKDSSTIAVMRLRPWILFFLNELVSFCSKALKFSTNFDFVL